MRHAFFVLALLPVACEAYDPPRPANLTNAPLPARKPEATPCRHSHLVTFNQPYYRPSFEDQVRVYTAAMAANAEMASVKNRPALIDEPAEEYDP